MNTTVLGSSGFIGSHLVAALRGRGFSVAMPDRDANLSAIDMGVVFYCIGLTADFRSRPFDTVTAHVCKFLDVLQKGRFDLLVYLSTTRLYARGAAGFENEPICVEPAQGDDLYNVSKVMGESLALSCGRPVRVVRLSNVYGPDWKSSNFLTSLIRSAVNDHHITLRSALQSAKDYVSIEDVVDLLIQIAVRGQQRIYNVASGRNITHNDLTSRLKDVCRCSVQTVDQAPVVAFPPISIARIQSEFHFAPRSVLNDLPGLVQQFVNFTGIQG